MTAAPGPVRVMAWIVWEDGVGELVVGHAVAWTPRAVHVRSGGPAGTQHEAWVLSQCRRAPDVTSTAASFSRQSCRG